MGIVTVYEEFTRLGYSLHWDAPVFYNQQDNDIVDELIDVVFTQQGDGTQIVFTHYGIPAADAVPHHKAALESTLHDLKKVLG